MAVIKKSLFVATLIIGVIGLESCTDSSSDLQSSQELSAAGYDSAAAIELSKIDLTDREKQHLTIARQGGFDGAVALEVLNYMRDEGLEFDLGNEMQTLSAAGFSPTSLIELVKIGAARVWETDLRVMIHSGISESTIMRLARRKFVDNHDDVLAGRDYDVLKKSGMSDTGLEKFVEAGGDLKQLQRVERLIREGKSEQEALTEVGI